MKMLLFKVFVYKHFFVKRLVQISTSKKCRSVNKYRIISEAKWIQVYLGNFGYINEN